MLWQVKQVELKPSKVVESPVTEAIAQAMATLPVAPELVIRRILWQMRGADAGNTEAALEQAERQLAALLCHDGPESD